MTETGVASAPVGSEPEGWRHAHLIPTYGTRTQQEQEKRATSCLLAVVVDDAAAVPAVGCATTGPSRSDVNTGIVSVAL